MAGTHMKACGVDGLSRRDLLEGVMVGEDALMFAPLAKVADERSDGKAGKWVRSWWKDSEGGMKPWGNMPLTEVTKDNLLDMYKVEGPRLWIPPPVAMETIMEVFNEDRIVTQDGPTFLCYLSSCHTFGESIWERS